MKNIDNNASFWATTTHSIEFPDGPEKFGPGPIAPQVAKPHRWLEMFHSQTKHQKSEMQFEICSHVMPGSFAPVDLDEVYLEIFDDCIVPAHLVKAHITSVTWGEPDVTEVDDADLALLDNSEFSEDDDLLWNALDPAAIGIGEPLERSQITATLGEIKQGKPRSVAMDDLDWELLDFD